MVVQDSSDSRDLCEWIRILGSDHRLVYNFSPTPLSMTENFDQGVSLASGEYVCLIGDDDGVSPQIVEAAQWAKANDIDALVPEQRAHYGWPDLRQRYHGAAKAGVLELWPFSGGAKLVDPEQELRKCAKHAAQQFAYLPRVYYGLVRRTCMQELRRQTGTYFPGVSPDLAAAAGVASFVHSVCIVDYPLFVPGSSAGSNAGLSSLKKHVGRLEDQSQLPKRYVQNWSALVPKFYSVQTIWAEALVTTLRLTQRTDVVSDFNVPLLHAMCVVFNPRYSWLVLSNLIRALRAQRRNLVVGVSRFGYEYLRTWGLRARALYNRLPFCRRRREPRRVGGLETIEAAVGVLAELLKEKPFGPTVVQNSDSSPVRIRPAARSSEAMG